MHTGDVKDPRSEVGVFPLGKLKSRVISTPVLKRFVLAMHIYINSSSEDVTCSNNMGITVQISVMVYTTGTTNDKQAWYQQRAPAVHNTAKNSDRI